MDRFASIGPSYHLFDDVGSPDADRIVVLMGSGAGAAAETVDYLNHHGESVGLLKVLFFRPFAIDAFLATIPKSARAIAVSDRTKEPGAVGEPMYSEVVAGLAEASETRNGHICLAWWEGVTVCPRRSLLLQWRKLFSTNSRRRLPKTFCGWYQR